MKNLKNLFILLILVASVTACKKSKTVSGYAYTIHKAGSGAKGAVGDAATFDVALYSDDSLLFSTAKEGRPMSSKIEEAKGATDPFSKLIQEALVTLKAGDSATFTMPLDTVKVKPQGFEKAKAAKFVISMHKFKPKAEVEKREGELKALGESIQASKPVFLARAKAVADSTTTMAAGFSAGKFPASVKELPSGLKIAVLNEGTGNLPKKGEMVLVNYYGALKSGKKFDDSFSRGQPINFPVGVGQVIPGWDEGLMQLKEGSTAIFFIPAQLAYGAQGKQPEIAPNSDLVFYVELLRSIDLNQ